MTEENFEIDKEKISKSIANTICDIVEYLDDEDAIVFIHTYLKVMKKMHKDMFSVDYIYSYIEEVFPELHMRDVDKIEE